MKSNCPEIDDEIFAYEQLLARCVGKVELVTRILNKFEERFGDDLKELSDAAMSGETSSIASVAHRIKGSCANVGAVQLTALAAKIENHAREGDVDYINPHLNDIQLAWETFREQVKSTLQNI